MTNKNYIIAGASKGTGRYLIDHLTKNGHKVYAVSRTEIPENENIISYRCDASNYEDLNLVFKNISKDTNKNICLINSIATWTGNKSLKELDSTFFEKSFNLNLLTTFNLIKSFISNFEYNPEKTSSFIQLGATASHRGSKNMSAFASFKAASRILIESLSREESKHGLHVCHLTIDGLIKNERTVTLNPALNNNQYISMKSLAKEIIHISQQNKDCWNFEVELRPYNEVF